MKYLIAIPIVFAAIVTAISFYLQPNDFIGCGEAPTAECQTADAIIVVSGGDTNARTDEGIRLYQAGWAPTIIFSGAAQDKTGPSNAAAMQSRALAAGVPMAAIKIEEDSATTQENAQNTESILTANQYRRVILVTSGYHQRRAAIEFERKAQAVEIANHPLLQDQDWSFWWWATPRGWWLAIGELLKIVISGAQGVTA